METKNKIKEAETILQNLSGNKDLEASITIKDIPKEELKRLSEEYGKPLFEPSTLSPYYWFSIPIKGNENLKLYCRTVTMKLKTVVHE